MRSKSTPYTIKSSMPDFLFQTSTGMASVLKVHIKYVTWHEKTMLMYTKYASLHSIMHTSFVNCIEFQIISSAISESFTDTLC